MFINVEDNDNILSESLDSLESLVKCIFSTRPNKNVETIKENLPALPSSDGTR